VGNFTSLDDIVEIIGKASETQFLEFKSGDALSDLEASGKNSSKSNLIHDVSAFANAGGGTIIYGLDEDRKTNPAVAKSLSVVTNEKADKQRLVNIIRDGMEPPFNAFHIEEFKVPAGGRVIVIDIDKAGTAHQCKDDHRYYQRVGTGTPPMHDHQIRDVMNRGVTPMVRLRATVHPLSTHGEFNAILFMELVNEGRRTAKLWSLDMLLPTSVGRIDHPGSYAIRKSMFVSHPNHQVWEFSCERSPPLGRTVMMPGQALTIAQSGGYPNVQLDVSNADRAKVERERLPIVFHLYVDDCPMRETVVPFDIWYRTSTS
jgi:hypothetical protein